MQLQFREGAGGWGTASSRLPQCEEERKHTKRAHASETLRQPTKFSLRASLSLPREEKGSDKAAANGATQAYMRAIREKVLFFK